MSSLVFSRRFSTPGGPAAVWTRQAEPLISAGQTWGGNPVTAVMEPNVLVESGTAKLWCRGIVDAVAGQAMAYITAPTSGSLTTPGNWTKYASNPVCGLGGSGVSGSFGSPTIAKFSTTYYAYGYDGTGDTSALYVTSSSDGLSWSALSSIMANNAVGGIQGWGGMAVWKEASTYYGLADGFDGNAWVTLLLSSSSPTSGWSYVAGPLSSLRVNAWETYGAVCMVNDGAKISGYYHIWYLAGPGRGVFSNIYHAYSTDRVNWTPTVALSLIRDGTLYETQQVADPFVIEISGTTYLFYSGVDNSTTPQTGYINVATFPGTLAQLVAGMPV